MELTLLRWIQQFATPQLDIFFQLVTMLGEVIPVLALFTLLYWVVDRELGEYLAFTMIFSLTGNGLIKDLFRLQRPIGEPGIRSLRVHTATGYSFPSGHSQTVATLWSGLGLWTGKRWVWALGAVITLLVGLSRLYLGVHYPKDVIVGILLGWAMALVCWKLFYRVQNRVRMYWLLAAASLLLSLVAPSRDYCKASGLMLGLAAGSWLENRSQAQGERLDTLPRSRKAVRWLVGVVLLGGLKLLDSLLLPDLWLSEYLCYAAIGFVGLGGYPWLVRRYTAAVGEGRKQ